MVRVCLLQVSWSPRGTTDLFISNYICYNDQVDKSRIHPRSCDAIKFRYVFMTKQSRNNQNNERAMTGSVLFNSLFVYGYTSCPIYQEFTNQRKGDVKSFLYCKWLIWCGKQRSWQYYCHIATVSFAAGGRQDIYMYTTSEPCTDTHTLYISANWTNSVTELWYMSMMKRSRVCTKTRSVSHNLASWKPLNGYPNSQK